jgi:hypothetical protein
MDKQFILRAIMMIDDRCCINNNWNWRNSNATATIIIWDSDNFPLKKAYAYGTAPQLY